MTPWFSRSTPASDPPPPPPFNGTDVLVQDEKKCKGLASFIPSHAGSYHRDRY